MSARSYYFDSYLTRFESTVEEAGELDDGPYVVLERSAFYPTSGGQPFDRGTLNGVAVSDVFVRESDGKVIHRLATPVARGETVVGEIDWPRRLDHMQQHTGQHVLSQAFIQVKDAATIGFHLGEDYVSIDLDAPELADRDAERAFAIANDVVTRDVAVTAWFPTPDELATLPLRKTPEVEGALRVVRIGDFDYSACGGTHVARTGELGLIHHLRTERIKRGSRVAFLVGGRARADYATKHAITQRLAAELTCSVVELPEAVGRLKDELQAARREIGRYKAEALTREAAELHARAEDLDGRALVVAAFESRPAEELRALVLDLTGRDSVVALVGSGGAKTQLVFGRSESLELDLRPALKAALDAVGGGKGGGTRIVQGGGSQPATLAEVAEALRAARTAVGA
ncbi:MAG: DHHA1 domain-containing protein [Gemmatimonadales bacterium]